MAPPGRRRRNPSCKPLLFLATFICLFLAQSAQAASAVLGIDIGTEYIKAALVKPGIPLDIVLTKDSRRKESAAIGFKPVADSSQLPERLYGSDALAVAVRFPGDVYPNLKPLLGSLLDTHDAVDSYKARFPALQLVEDASADTLGFNGKGVSDKEAPFTVEELIAMELTSIKHNAEAMAGKGLAVRSTVITVPTFYTVDERRAIESAAELAGLEVTSLISDGLAVGTNYAMSRTFPNVDEGETPEYHLVYDMGAGSTTATVLKFQSRTVKDVGKFNKTIQEISVVGTGWDRTLGGDALNELVVEDMIQKFVETKAAKAQGVTVAAVKAHGRTMAKLWRESEKQRQVLSANTVTQTSFEGLYEDIDFKYKLTRADFETLASAFAARISKPLDDAVANANSPIKDIKSVMLHGGMIRTPLVQRELEKLVGDAAKLKSNVNADEAAVFGAAFRAAGLSASFKVKEIRANDAANYVATVKWTAKGKERRQNVFVPTSQVGNVKQMPFNITEDFTLSISQQVPIPGSSEASERPIRDVKIANLTATIAELTSKYGCDRTTIKTLLALRIDPVTGLPEVSGGTSSCEVDESAKKGGVVEDVKGFFGFGGKKDQEPLTDDETSGETTELLSEEVSSTGTPSGSASTSASASSSSSSSNATKPSAKVSKEPKKRTQVINLEIEPLRTDKRQSTPDQLEQMKERLRAFNKSDKSRRQREELFNSLEAFTYRARDLLTDEGIIGVSTEAQRNAIETLLGTTGEWLHGEGATAVIDIIKEKLTELKGLVEPLQKRKEEGIKRPGALSSLQKALDQTGDLVKSMREQIDRAAAAASSAAEQASSSISSAGDEEEGPVTESLDDLDDDLESSSTVTSAKTKSTSTIELSPYSEADYERLSSAYDASKEWLAEQLEAQGALTASDEPALLYSDLNEMTKQLNELMSSMRMKKSRAPPKKSSSSKSKSKKASKTKSKTSTDAGDGESAGTSTPASETTPTSVVAAEKTVEHEEL